MVIEVTMEGHFHRPDRSLINSERQRLPPLEGSTPCPFASFIVRQKAVRTKDNRWHYTKMDSTYASGPVLGILRKATVQGSCGN